MRLWELLGGKQIPFPLDFNLEKDKAGVVILPPQDKSLRIGPTQDMEQTEKSRVLIKFPLLNLAMPDGSILSFYYVSLSIFLFI